MKSKLREKIENIRKLYNYDIKGCELTDGKNMFKFNDLEFCATRDGLFRIGFNNSNIPEQEIFNYINNNYEITVHHGKYEPIKFDVSNCKVKDLDKKKEYPDRAYYTCDTLDETKAVELFDYLYELNK